MYRVLNEDLGKKLYKIIKRHELTEHDERMRVERSRHILNEIAQGTLPNLVFTDEKKFNIQQVVNHQNDRVRVPQVQSRVGLFRNVKMQSVIVWAAVTATGSPLVFVPCEVKLNSERYISIILESQLLPWVTEHFQGLPWSFQQDSTTSHGSNVTQTWIQRNIPSFISRDVWQTMSPGLSPLEFSLWSILETRGLLYPSYFSPVHFGDKGSSLPLILLSSPSKQNCKGNGQQFHKNRYVPLAMHL
ncbi:hypothetical protein FHG87_000453 [Trinorchestia longiramus]|nr:hypothetical protein FHG87_000453 [Trinorchestia longiramus]